MLVISMLLMGFGTFLVGLLPTYQQIGILAPVLLIVLRLLQAMGLGDQLVLGDLRLGIFLIFGLSGHTIAPRF